MLWGSLLCSYKDCLMCEQWQAFFRVRRLVVADVDVLLNSLFKEGLITPAAVRVSVEQLPAFGPSRTSCPSEEGSRLPTDAGRDIKDQLFPPKLEWFWWVRFSFRALYAWGGWACIQLLPPSHRCGSQGNMKLCFRDRFLRISTWHSFSLLLDDPHDVRLRFWDWWKGYDLMVFLRLL